MRLRRDSFGSDSGGKVGLCVDATGAGAAEPVREFTGVCAAGASAALMVEDCGSGTGEFAMLRQHTPDDLVLALLRKRG